MITGQSDTGSSSVEAASSQVTLALLTAEADCDIALASSDE